MRGEASDLDRVVPRAAAAWSQAQRMADPDAYLDAVVLSLHGFYSGLERLLELVTRHVASAVPRGETWRRNLLKQVAQDVVDVRPAVISPDRVQAWDEYRRFRHLARNVYTVNLVPERMAGLMAALPGLWLTWRAELLMFADFLAFLAQPD